MNFRSGRKSKYGATRVEHDNHSFASKLESSVYTMLKARENAGEIEILQVQDHVYLTDARISYVPDFKCLDKKTDKVFWVEAKGFSTPAFNIKKKLWRFYGPGILELWGGTHQRPVLIEIIEIITD